jgi:hypothetical protein
MSRIETQPPQAKADDKAQSARPRDPDFGLGEAFAANLAASEIAAQITQEVMDFAGRRMRAQVEFVTSVPQMGDVTGLMEAQFRFLEQASRDYAQEFGQITEVIRRAGATSRRRAGQD